MVSIDHLLKTLCVLSSVLICTAQMGYGNDVSTYTLQTKIFDETDAIKDAKESGTTDPTEQYTDSVLNRIRTEYTKDVIPEYPDEYDDLFAEDIIELVNEAVGYRNSDLNIGMFYFTENYRQHEFGYEVTDTIRWNTYEKDGFIYLEFWGAGYDPIPAFLLSEEGEERWIDEVDPEKAKAAATKTSFSRRALSLMFPIFKTGTIAVMYQNNPASPHNRFDKNGGHIITVRVPTEKKNDELNAAKQHFLNTLKHA